MGQHKQLQLWKWTCSAHHTDFTDADERTEVGKDIDKAGIADGDHGGDHGDCAGREYEAERKHCADCVDDVFGLDYEKVVDTKELMNSRDG